MALSLPALNTVSAPRQQADLEAPLSQALGATAAQAFSELPVPSLYRTYELGQAQSQGTRLDQASALAQIKDAGIEGRLKVDEHGISQPALAILIDRKRDEVKRQEILSRAPTGFGAGAAKLGTTLATSLLDPINVGLAFVPVVGEARYARYLAEAKGLIGRTGVRAGVGAAEGAAGAAIAEPFVYTAKRQEQADYDFQDSLLNVAFGTVFGGGLHVVAGAGREVGENLTTYRDLGPATRERLRTQYYAAEANKPAFDAAARDIAKEVDGKADLPGLKGRDRAVEKTLVDYGGDPGQVKDIVRGTVIVDSIEKAQAALEATGRKFGTLENVRNALQRDAPPITDDGYRDIKMNVKVAGRTYELQINTPEMLAAKDKAHDLYKRARTIEGEIKAENRDPSPREVSELDALRSKQRAIYDEAWAASLRNSSSDTSVPLRVNDVKGNRLPSATSQARQTQAAVSDAGTPSTLANAVPSGNLSGNAIARPSAEIIAQEATPKVREQALRTAMAQAAEGRAVEVEPIFHNDAPAAAKAAEQDPVRGDVTADPKAAEAADRQLDAEPVRTDELAHQETLLAEDLANVQAAAKIAGIDISDELAEADELIKKADLYARAARAAALCGLGH